MILLNPLVLVFSDVDCLPLHCMHVLHVIRIKYFDYVGLWACNKTVYEQMMTALTRREASRSHTSNRRFLGTLYPLPTRAFGAP
jgi:hypothetical protein